ncbi:MAG: peptide ABC transporter substrate-binding protein [Kyrpidia sp.]|nr:peptide ABC transporter substrate-binding protein [Kyrpidia sp.]
MKVNLWERFRGNRRGWAIAAAGIVVLGSAVAGLWGWAAGASPDKHQEVTLWLGDEPAPLDPGLTGDQWAMDLLGAVEEGLMRWGPDLKPRPALAEWMDVSPDNARFVFHLRSARWSDGVPLKAADFRYAWLRALDPANRSPSARLLFPIKGAKAYHEGKAGKEQVAVEAPDDRTLQVTLERPNPDFPWLTALPAYYPVRKDAVEKFGDRFGTGPAKMVFIGPFRLSGWEHDRRVTLIKNPAYWDARRVRLTDVTFQIVKDLAQRIPMYETGGLEQTGVAGAWMDRWKGRPDGVSIPEASVFFLVFNPERYPPFGNVKIRLALSYALDRRDYVRRIWDGAADPAYGMVPPPISGRRAPFRQENGDLFVDHCPEAARALLQDGLRDMHLNALPPLTFLSDNSEPSVKTAQWLRDQWMKNLGIDVRIDRVSPPVRLQRQRAGNYQMALAGWGAEDDDASAFLHLWVSDSPDNLVHYRNPEYDRLIAAADEAPDNPTRVEQLERAERVLIQDMPVAPLFFRRKVWLQKPYIKDVVYFPVGLDWDLTQAYIEGKSKER